MNTEPAREQFFLFLVLCDLYVCRLEYTPRTYPRDILVVIKPAMIAEMTLESDFGSEDL